jgi:hypothetical protein
MNGTLLKLPCYSNFKKGKKIFANKFTKTSVSTKTTKKITLS